VRKLGSTLLVVGLLVATATAFAVTERLKLEDSPVFNTQIRHMFSPVCTACKPEARSSQIRFRLRREEEIRLDIADSTGTVVRHSVGAGVFQASSQEFAWDGRDDSGKVVADGIYRAELRLIDEDRTFEFPDEIRVDATPPTIEDVKVRHGVFSPDGDGRADWAGLRYRFSEPAYSVLFVDGKRIGPSFRKKPVGTRQWYGRGKRPGEYRLALAAQDLVGNVSPSTREFTVRIRYIQLFKRRYVVRGNVVRLRVSTDAKTVRWRLGGRSGVSKPPKLAIPVPIRPGSYRLTVTANGHRARATVVVKIARR
jgi:FlgD Ig-like domain